MPRHGMLDATAIILNEIDHEPARKPTTTQILSIMQVGGALLRQLRKTTGSDDLEGLTDRFVQLAYRNEIARVVRGWPRLGDWLRPAAFLGTALVLRKRFAAHGWSPEPLPLPRGALPSVLDGDDIGIFVIDWDARRYRYASPAGLRFFGSITPAQLLSMPLDPHARVHADHVDEAWADFTSVARGGTIRQKTYPMLLPGVRNLLVLHAESLYDDDDQLVGQLCATVDADAVDHSVPESRRHNGTWVARSRLPL